jgi:hypothetical protein
MCQSGIFSSYDGGKRIEREQRERAWLSQKVASQSLISTYLGRGKALLGLRTLAKHQIIDL